MAITEKRVSLNNPSGYKVPLPEEPSYEDEDRMSDLSTKVETGEGPQKSVAEPVASKSKIVTKEELAKSGYDNLRDYMNAQKGLTRKGESSKSNVGYSEMLKNAPAGTSDAAMKALKSNAQSEANKMADLEKGNSRGQKSSVATPKTTKGESRKPYSPGEIDNSFIGSKFAKGGKTRSSASRRGDGIATKGFTKGRNL